MAAAGSQYDNIGNTNENIILSPTVELTSTTTSATTEKKEEYTFEPITEPMIECPVCLDDYDEKSKVVTCSCGYAVHIKCMQEYLLQNTKEPHCMHCRKMWDRDFQYTNLTSAFINGKYKKHRKELLFELEKAQFPATMNHVIEYKKKNTYKEELEETTKKANILRQEAMQCEIKIMKLTKKIKDIESGIFTPLENKKEDIEKKQFIKPCPVENCRGFLSSAYKCGLCSTFVCSKCFEIKGKTKDVEHTCDENMLKNAEAIKNETKGCPQCGVPIYKISGCDQMWCTICNIAFSWKSGRIEKGVVHNPHYYQWLQTQGTQVRNPGDHVCGGIPHYYTIATVLRRSGLSNYAIQVNNNLEINTSDLINLHQKSVELRDYIIDPMREKLTQALNNTDLRVRYLSGEIDQEHLKKMVTQRDNIRQKTQAMLFILELYMTILIEVFNNLSKPQDRREDVKNNIIELYNRLEQISIYCNEELLKISKNYKMKVYYVNEKYCILKKMVNHIELQKFITEQKEKREPQQ
jgi:hypothetical protein